MSGDLALALAPYTSHSIGCAIYQRSWVSGEPPCTCGLDDVRSRLTTPSQGLDAATVERRRKALREALEHVDNIAGEMNGAAERAHLIDADDAAMNLADAFGVEFAPGWEDEVAALATDPHQHGGKGA